MCIGVKILSENRLRRRSCVTKVRVSALYMYLENVQTCLYSESDLVQTVLRIFRRLSAHGCGISKVGRSNFCSDETLREQAPFTVPVLVEVVSKHIANTSGHAPPFQ